MSKLQAWAVRHPKAFRRILNRYPCYKGTGGKVTHIAPDWSEMRVRIRLGWRTRNYVGTIFGGSLYACIDPMFMFMLMHRLGPGYVVWDKAASIRFRRPGRTTLTAVCRMPDAEVEEVRRLLRTEPKVDRTYNVEFVDRDGVVHASCEKVVNVRRKDAESPVAVPLPSVAPTLAEAPGRVAAKPAARAAARAPGRAAGRQSTRDGRAADR